MDHPTQTQRRSSNQRRQLSISPNQVKTYRVILYTTERERHAQ
jgi:hypothetical protein